ncbi:hypothetical protein JCM10213_003830 [Rhodosporidiobolus nylandii]
MLDTFLEAVKAKPVGAALKTARFYIGYDTHTRASKLVLKEVDLQRLAQRCPRVRALFFWKDLVDLVWLEPFVGLRELHLAETSLNGSRPFVLASVEQLTLSFALADATVRETLLKPCTLPSLRVLCEVQDPYGFPVFHPDAYPPLLERGDAVMCTPFARWPALSRLTQQPRVLLDVDLSEFEGSFDMPPFLPTDVVQLRLHAAPRLFGRYGFWPQQSIVSKAMDALTNGMRQNLWPHLKVVYAPVELAKCDKGPYVDEIVAFLAQCRCANVEVIFEPTPHPYYDSLVSPEFWRRCKALKAKEEEEKAQVKEAERQG